MYIYTVYIEFILIKKVILQCYLNYICINVHSMINILIVEGYIKPDMFVADFSIANDMVQKRHSLVFDFAVIIKNIVHVCPHQDDIWGFNIENNIFSLRNYTFLCHDFVTYGYSTTPTSKTHMVIMQTVFCIHFLKFSFDVETYKL